VSRFIRSLPVVVVLGGFLVLVGSSGALAATKTKTPIKHFVSLMQQNHSFDNYFGTYPHANGIPENQCMPINPARPRAKCIKPFHIGDRVVPDLPQNEEVFRGQYRNGRMTGFIDGVREDTGRI